MIKLDVQRFEQILSRAKRLNFDLLANKSKLEQLKGHKAVPPVFLVNSNLIKMIYYKFHKEILKSSLDFLFFGTSCVYNRETHTE